MELMSDNRKLVILSTGKIQLDDYAGTTAMIPNRILIATTKNITQGPGLVMAFAPETLKMIKRNFDEKHLGRDVPIVYEHPMNADNSSTAAAGWIGGLELEEDQGVLKLFATGIEWTEQGKRDVIGRVYKYTSVGIDLEYTSTKDHRTNVGAVLYELSLTNNPADHNLEEIEKIQLAQKRKAREDNKKEFNMPGDHKDKKMDNNADENKKKMADHDDIAQLKKEMEKKMKEMSDLYEKFKTEQGKNKKLEKENEDAKLTVIKMKRESKLNDMILKKQITPAQKEKALELSDEGFKGFELSVEGKKAYSDKSEANSEPSDKKEPKFDDKLIELANKKVEKGIELKRAFEEASRELRENRE